MPQNRPSPESLRVCHLSTAHSADDSRVFWRECVGLAAAGFQVTLIARADADRRDHGVRIVALPTYRRRLVRMTWGVARAFAATLRARPHIVHVHDPELIPLLVLLRLLGHKVVYDAHEWLSKQVAAKEYLPGPARSAASRVARTLEWVVGRAANRVVTVNAACASVFPPDKAAIVANYPQPSRFTAPAEPAPPGGEPFFVYVGGITAARGVAEMVDSIDRVNTSSEARLRLVGRFTPAPLRRDMARRPGWAYVDDVGEVGHDAVADHLRGAVAGLATLLPTPNHLISSPVKVFEYMAMGLPVILSDFPRWRELLDGVDCALWVDPSDPGAIAEAMRELLHDPERRAAMGSAARRAVAQRFNWDTQLATLVDVYGALM